MKFIHVQIHNSSVKTSRPLPIVEISTGSSSIAVPPDIPCIKPYCNDIVVQMAEMNDKPLVTE
jgi:hypothetical protein